MDISDRGLMFIRGLEGCKLQAYKDIAGIWTIGIGHTGGVREGDTCTPEQALEWLKEDAQTAVGAINRSVKVDLSQNEFDALVSLVYNIGQGNFKNSTVLRLVNGGSKAGAAEAFLMWNKVKGVESQGLTNRRYAEKLLFLGDV